MENCRSEKRYQCKDIQRNAIKSRSCQSLQHRFQPLSTEATPSDSVVSFSVEHSITHDEIDPPLMTRRYPERNRCPPDRLTY